MEGDQSGLHVENLAEGTDRDLVQVIKATNEVLPDGSYTFHLQTNSEGHTIAAHLSVKDFQGTL